MGILFGDHNPAHCSWVIPEALPRSRLECKCRMREVIVPRNTSRGVGSDREEKGASADCLHEPLTVSAGGPGGVV